MTWEEEVPGWTRVGSVKGPPGDTIVPFTYTMADVLVAKVGTAPLPVVGGSYDIVTVGAMVGTGPIGSPTIFDVKVNNVSVFDPADLPTIAPGTRTATAGTQITTRVNEGDYLTVDVVEPGGGQPADLTVVIMLLRVGTTVARRDTNPSQPVE